MKASPTKLKDGTWGAKKWTKIPVGCPHCMCEWDIDHYDDDVPLTCPDCGEPLKLPGWVL